MPYTVIEIAFPQREDLIVQWEKRTIALRGWLDQPRTKKSLRHLDRFKEQHPFRIVCTFETNANNKTEALDLFNV